MRILMVARRYPPDVRSGTETVFENLYAQARRHHEVQLCVGFRQDRAMVPPEATAVDLRGRRFGAWPAMALGAIRAARAFSPDVVLSNSIEVRVPGVPCVTIVHDLNFGRAERSFGVVARERFYAAQCRGLAAVVAVSEATKLALERLGVEGVHVIPNGVDLGRFVPHERPPDASVHFVYPSRFIPGKGQHAAIDALGRMRPDQRKGLRLTLVGALADRIYVDRLKVQAYGLPVDFAFDVQDIVPWYQSADVVLFPTLMTEGFGFTAVEGMACGKPVLYYDQPAVREATGGIAVGVPRDDASALRDAMLRLAADPAERRRLGEAGRAYVRRYDWAEVWQRYADLLQQLRR